MRIFILLMSLFYSCFAVAASPQIVYCPQSAQCEMEGGVPQCVIDPYSQNYFTQIPSYANIIPGQFIFTDAFFGSNSARCDYQSTDSQNNYVTISFTNKTGVNLQVYQNSQNPNQWVSKGGVFECNTGANGDCPFYIPS